MGTQDQSQKQFDSLPGRNPGLREYWSMKLDCRFRSRGNGKDKARFGGFGFDAKATHRVSVGRRFPAGCSALSSP
ncbi:hypothetical protein J2847_005636 [Azospirillum agricola]|uniref:hypothetical protein n=1 Tax=Azospirillum agricola TaxID=1720247 RepID=UPI001AE1A30B|nr:hypothetical protein [Azospirillum agricola]MBP2232311.1 hypothetical protein [Azospirillum agricola]